MGRKTNNLSGGRKTIWNSNLRCCFLKVSLVESNSVWLWADSQIKAPLMWQRSLSEQGFCLQRVRETDSPGHSLMYNTHAMYSRNSQNSQHQLLKESQEAVVGSGKWGIFTSVSSQLIELSSLKFHISVLCIFHILWGTKIVHLKNNTLSVSRLLKHWLQWI